MQLLPVLKNVHWGALRKTASACHKGMRQGPALLVPLGLGFPQARILSFRLREKLFVTSFLHESSFMKYRDGITEPAGGKTVGDIEGAFVIGDIMKLGINFRLGNGVQFTLVDRICFLEKVAEATFSTRWHVIHQRHGTVRHHGGKGDVGGDLHDNTRACGNQRRNKILYFHARIFLADILMNAREALLNPGIHGIQPDILPGLRFCGGIL